MMGSGRFPCPAWFCLREVLADKTTRVWVVMKRSPGDSGQNPDRLAMSGTREEVESGERGLYGIERPMTCRPDQ